MRLGQTGVGDEAMTIANRGPVEACRSKPFCDRSIPLLVALSDSRRPHRSRVSSPDGRSSVMAKQLRHVANTTRGKSHRSCWTGVPNSLRISMLARVGAGLGVENVVTKRAAADLITDHGIFHSVEAKSAVVPGDVRSPLSHLLDLPADRSRAGNEPEKTAQPGARGARARINIAAPISSRSRRAYIHNRWRN